MKGVQLVPQAWHQSARLCKAECSDDICLACMADVQNVLRVGDAYLRVGKRKSLSRALSSLYKLPLQLLPFYARITATLAQQFPEMGTAVADAAIQSFKTTIKQKSASVRLLEPRVRASRYLCELARFRVVDAGAVLLR
jgi:hypothetical protein